MGCEGGEGNFQTREPRVWGFGGGKVLCDQLGELDAEEKSVHKMPEAKRYGTVGAIGAPDRQSIIVNFMGGD